MELEKLFFRLRSYSYSPMYSSELESMILEMNNGRRPYMYSPEELREFLPSACKGILSSAIGQSLSEVERFFGKNLMSYLKSQPPYDETSNLFSTAFGATQFFSVMVWCTHLVSSQDGSLFSYFLNLSPTILFAKYTNFQKLET